MCGPPAEQCFEEEPRNRGQNHYPYDPETGCYDLDADDQAMIREKEKHLIQDD